MSSNAVFLGRSRNDLIKLAITVLLPLFYFPGADERCVHGGF